MTDVLGISVAPGSTVAYASRKGAKMWLRTMKVLDVQPDRISGLLPTGRAVTIRRTTDVVACAGGVL